ncbi:hypothetical protein [Hydrogenimonas thermophila]|uniref:Uncharacterized protein n=1 Tax=Hydrogenimonas thermophila TaxID=223786 RepID=A0A1I5ULR8_9BACT|nr:hypothetical protein [Hydrogenimonas thermophila]SFP96182.1 hypothetical protein SAMN05216234_1655 [Hydrogenimonas thermophila]
MSSVKEAIALLHEQQKKTNERIAKLKEEQNIRQKIVDQLEKIDMNNNHILAMITPFMLATEKLHNTFENSTLEKLTENSESLKQFTELMQERYNILESAKRAGVEILNEDEFEKDIFDFLQNKEFKFADSEIAEKFKFADNNALDKIKEFVSNIMNNNNEKEEELTICQN